MMCKLLEKILDCMAMEIIISLKVTNHWFKAMVELSNVLFYKQISNWFLNTFRMPCIFRLYF